MKITDMNTPKTCNEQSNCQCMGPSGSFLEAYQSVLKMVVKSQFYNVASEFQSSNSLNETREYPPADHGIDQREWDS